MQVPDDDFEAWFSQQPGYLMNRTSRQFMRLSEALLAPYGIGVAAFPVLMTLRRQPDLTQKELAECLHLEQPSVAQLLSRLERDGMVLRRPDPRDGRASLISLTPRAQGLVPQILALSRHANGAAAAGLTEAELAEFIRLIRRIGENIEAELQRTKEVHNAATTRQG